MAAGGVDGSTGRSGGGQIRSGTERIGGSGDAEHGVLVGRREGRGWIRVTRTVDDVPAAVLDGLRVAAPAATLLACARDLGLLDMVVLVDSALRTGCTAEEIARTAAPYRSGAPLLRRALELADGRSESPWETLLRVLHVSVGVQVVPQHTVRTTDGTFVARGDLWLPSTRVLHEYDGGVHRSSRVHTNDLRRDRALTAAGWTRRGYVAADLCREPVAVLRDIDDALGRPHRPEGVRPWIRLLSGSTLTESGRARLRGRLGL
ncbi:conserved hypothetical protein [Cellulomonas flavigena DSM 20109]|uniref:DUF559 domain-containing protein n=1 Tax=Cellulomonas flavigena (strain ATCC 482 / DSM 20109 / BCRC 11376 / JCM 18109 / NBRC 3775 / NCIMB 8073 / NRS 134) TaxID=446466 RepID=D5UJQ9_CELFN|nr:hypothetical protein [Cellulomonas flavigena]ADG75697.1 conserved hypothetical protein [Cellulomonas flavigena DSM 20109]